MTVGVLFGCLAVLLLSGSLIGLLLVLFDAANQKPPRWVSGPAQRRQELRRVK